MSQQADKGEKPKKKRKGMMTALMGVGMLGLGGGGAYGMIAAGIIGGGKKHEDNQPKLIRKGEEDPFAVKAEGKEEGAAVEAPGPGGSVYRTAYFNFPDEFTSNLKDSEALIQVSLACATRRDGRVLMWIKDNELAIRSALLMVMADTPENDIYTIQGKQRLQQRLTDAINHVLTQKEGFGGVDSVFFKTFIVQ